MAAGIRTGMTRVLEIVRRHETLTPKQRAALDRAAEEAKKSWIGGLFFLGMSLFFGLLGAPQAGLAMLVLLAIAVFVASFRLGRTPEWQRTLRGTSGRSRGNRWVLGGGGSSSSSRSSSSSSSSSFGGGSSGGGGASGRW